MAINRKYRILGFVLFFAFFMGCKKKGDEGALPDLRLTLGSKDNRPFGASVFRSMVEHAMPETDFSKSTEPFDQWYKKYLKGEYAESLHAFVLVSPYLDAKEKEVKAMKDYVSEGNILWICTNGTSESFEKEFKTGLSYNPIGAATKGSELKETFKYLSDSSAFEDARFGYYFFPFQSAIDSPDSYLKKVISLNTHKKPDGWQMKVGNGELIFITNAEALGNYFQLTHDNYRYALGLLSYIPMETEGLTYDEFYKRNLSRQPDGSSVFDAILSKPPLRWAFWIIICGIALAILTNLFRRQRIIPVQVPNQNTTVAFTETIARLYFNQKDNSNIAQKMIQHFLEHIRTVYYLPHQKLDNEFARLLAGKTNQPLPKTERMVQRMAAIMLGMEVNDDLLLELNKDLQELKPTSKNK